MEKTVNSQQAHEATLIVVLGMHRSGTSAITRAMGTMGGNFGSRLMPAVPGVNDKGFFEDLDVNAINIEAMAAAGTDWHAMASIELNAIDPRRLDQLQTKAIAILREKCAAKTFVLKDPRIARLLPFWQPVFACLDVRVVYVVAIRNPISVAQSLARRNEFPEEKSYLLWLAHVVPALVMTEHSRRAIVDYDNLMDSPGKVLTGIASQLELSLNEQAVAEFEREFLDNQLRHTRFSSQDLNLVRSAPRQLKDLFAALEIASRVGDGQHTSELVASIENAQRYLEDVAPLLRHEWRVEQQVQQLHVMLGDSSARIGELDNTLAGRNQRVWELDNALANRNHRIEELDNTLANCTCRIGELDNALLEAESTRAQIEHLSSENSSQKETIRSLEQTIQSLEQTIATQQASLSNSAEATARILNSTSWRVTAPLRAIRRSVFPRKV